MLRRRISGLTGFSDCALDTLGCLRCTAINAGYLEQRSLCRATTEPLPNAALHEISNCATTAGTSSAFRPRPISAKQSPKVDAKGPIAMGDLMRKPCRKHRHLSQFQSDYVVMLPRRTGRPFAKTQTRLFHAYPRQPRILQPYPDLLRPLCKGEETRPKRTGTERKLPSLYLGIPFPAISPTFALTDIAREAVRELDCTLCQHAGGLCLQVNLRPRCDSFIEVPQAVVRIDRGCDQQRRLKEAVEEVGLSHFVMPRGVSAKC